MLSAVIASLGVIADARRRQRRRRHLIAVVLLIGLGAGIAGAVLTRPPETPQVPAPGIRVAAPEAVLTRSPYMGVSCRRPNVVRCDRVGLAVWLRQPALSVSAVVAGRHFNLDDPNWSGSDAGARRLMFAGFLQPAGVERLGVRPDHRGRWIGNPTPTNSVRLRIDFGNGDIAVTRVDVDLMAGWG